MGRAALGGVRGEPSQPGKKLRPENHRGHARRNIGPGGGNRVLPDLVTERPPRFGRYTFRVKGMKPLDGRSRKRVMNRQLRKRVSIEICHLMVRKSVQGSRPGDIVPPGKRQGDNVGHVAMRASGSFTFRTAGGTVNGISRGHCSMVQRGDGYGYGHGPDRFLKKDEETIHGTGDVAFIPAPKGGVSCGLDR